jgi:HSP20 family protein
MVRQDNVTRSQYQSLWDAFPWSREALKLTTGHGFSYNCRGASAVAFEGKLDYADELLKFGKFRYLVDWQSRVQTQAGTVWNPPVSIHEDHDAIQLSLDVPGTRPSDLGIHLENGVLTISGERQLDYGVTSYSRAEHPLGNFSTSFRVPRRVNADAVTAQLVNGVLTVRLPKHGQENDTAPDDGVEELRDMTTDVNYEAYLRDAAELKENLPGHLVAYAGGKRIAEGADASELARHLPPAYRGKSVFITDVSPEPVRFRRPFRIRER